MSEKINIPDHYGRWEADIKIGKKEDHVTVGYWRDGCKGCGICVDVCPKQVWEIIEAKDKWNGQVVQVTDAAKCIKCMLCEIHCPDFCIKIY